MVLSYYSIHSLPSNIDSLDVRKAVATKTIFQLKKPVSEQTHMETLMEKANLIGKIKNELEVMDL